jgi:hypothetical protein
MVAAESPSATAAWLICFREPHDVIAGAVACPLRRSDVPLEECLECRHLGYVSDEHRMSRSCSTGDDRP